MRSRFSAYSAMFLSSRWVVRSLIYVFDSTFSNCYPPIFLSIYLSSSLISISLPLLLSLSPLIPSLTLYLSLSLILPPLTIFVSALSISHHLCFHATPSLSPITFLPLSVARWAAANLRDGGICSQAHPAALAHSEDIPQGLSAPLHLRSRGRAHPATPPH